jgi:hypothetical protein
MIVQSIQTTWDRVNYQGRRSEFRTIEDPTTNKKTIEVVQYLYNRVAELLPSSTKKGQQFDRKV